MDPIVKAAADAEKTADALTAAVQDGPPANPEDVLAFVNHLRGALHAHALTSNAAVTACEQRGGNWTGAEDTANRLMDALNLATGLAVELSELVEAAIVDDRIEAA